MTPGLKALWHHWRTGHQIHDERLMQSGVRGMFTIWVCDECPHTEWWPKGTTGPTWVDRRRK